MKYSKNKIGFFSLLIIEDLNKNQNSNLQHAITPGASEQAHDMSACRGKQPWELFKQGFSLTMSKVRSVRSTIITLLKGKIGKSEVTWLSLLHVIHSSKFPL